MAEVSSNTQTAKYGNGLSKDAVANLNMADGKHLQFRPSPNGPKNDNKRPKKILHRQDTPLQLQVPVFKDLSRFEKSTLIEEEEKEGSQ